VPVTPVPSGPDYQRGSFPASRPNPEPGEPDAMTMDRSAGTTHPLEDLGRLARGEHGDPFAVLGQHADGDGRVIRAFMPEARRAWVVNLEAGEPGKRFELERVHPDGGFALAFPDRKGPFPYRLALENHEGYAWEFVDPYRFGPVLSDFELHLLGEGTHTRNYESLGAHIREWDGIRGVQFAVWAPNADRASVIGNFNHWDGRRHPMRRCGEGGIWEIFIPDLGQGEHYKYEIRSRINHYLVQKSDPYGFAAEFRPRTASIVWDVTRFNWSDTEWMAARSTTQALDAPISVYEVHLGSWKRKGDGGEDFLSYRELADQLVAYLAETGFTHIELLPTTEHPFDGSWGYQPVGYYAPTSRFGTPDDFVYFVDTLHRHGYGVILDWVPAHFPRDVHGLGFFDGSHLYEHEDPRLGEHKDWGTKIFNYGRAEVRNFLLGNALFWLERYHIDGIRVDAVASMLYLDYSREAGEWLPNIHGGHENLEAIDFLRRLNELCHRDHPGVLTTAEESTSWKGVSRPTTEGGLGFDLKWNMGWMNDTLAYMARDPIHRKYEHGALTFSLIYAFNENFMLPLSHDEVVHGKRSLLEKMPGDGWQKFANLRLLYGYMYGHPGKKLLFMGDEIAQGREWDHQRSLDWHLLVNPQHAGIKRLVADLNALYKAEPSLHQVDFDWTGFRWLELGDAENSVLAFLRRGKDPADATIVVCNFTPIVREGYRVGVPEAGDYRELLNTDAGCYGGSNVGNDGALHSTAEPHGDQPHHLALRLPPLGVLILKRSGA